MCGVFAFVAANDQPREDLFTLAVRGAAKRGPDAHGWWALGDGITKGPGAIDPAKVTPRPIVIGHSRLATMGTHGSAGTQPILTPEGDVVVHNGNVRNWKDLDPSAVTDSFALAAEYSRNRNAGAPPLHALDDCLSVADQKACSILILDREGWLIGARIGLPLYSLEDWTGNYLSSGRLPGAQQIPEGQAVALVNTIRNPEHANI